MPREPRTPIGRAADAAGRAIGAAAEQHFRRRHVSRLRRTGHLSAQAPIGALGAGGFGVREGNDVRVLIDGEDAFAAMASAIEGARRTIHLTGWSADPAFAMSRADPRRTLGALLAGAGERGVRTRVLLWRGAPLPVIHPSRADNAAAARGFNAIDGVTCALDAHEYLLDCRHEKLLIVDDEIAFVGGLDLTALRSDRWDTTGHPPRDSDGWHDAAVRATGPVVADVVEHFGQRWGEVTGERLPASAVPEAMGTIAARLIRTIPERVYRFAPDGDFGALGAYLDVLGAAQRFVYLENQFLWAPEIVDVLAAKLRRPPRDDFRVVVVLPDHAHTGQDATLGQLSRLRDEDAGRRLLALTVQSEEPGHHVYVHAKIGIVDDRWLTVGSVNLNTHSLLNDTEVNLAFAVPDLARSVREDLFREHTGQDAAGVDPVAFVDGVLRPLAEEQTRRRAAGLPPTGRVRSVEQGGRRTDLLLGPISSIVVDG